MRIRDSSKTHRQAQRRGEIPQKAAEKNLQILINNI